MLSSMYLNHFYFLWLYQQSSRYRHSYIIGSGIFIWLFLLLTQPFGLYNNNLGGPVLLALFLLPFGISWVIINYGYDYLFKSLFRQGYEETIPQNFLFWILKVITLVHVIYVFREILCEWNCIDLAEYLELWLACSLLFIFTYIPYSLYARFKYFQSIVVQGPSGSQLFEFKGEGKRTESVNLEDVLYTMADDNYVDIVFLLEGKTKKLVLRGTISSLENQLKGQNRFIRVHRKYIVNLRHATRITQSLVVIGSGNTVIEIPVSKKYEDRLAPIV